MNPVHPILADAGGIIWLIFIVLYWVFQGVTANSSKEKARQRAEQMKREREANEREAPSQAAEQREQRDQQDLNQDLRDFLEQLSGQQTAPKPAAPAPAPVPTPVIQFDQPHVPPPVPVRTPEPEPPPVAMTDFEEHEMHVYEEHDYTLEDVAEIDFDQIEESTHSLMQMQMIKVDLSPLRYREPRMKTRLAGLSHEGVDRPALTNRERLKDAIVAGVLLGPPKSLRPDPFENDQGSL